MNALGNSVKFIRVISGNSNGSVLSSIRCALHTCAAYPTLRNPVPPSRTVESQGEHFVNLRGAKYLWVPLPSWEESIAVLRHGHSSMQ